MKHVRLLFILAGVALVACSGNKPGKEITIRGRVTYPQPGDIVLSEVRKDSQKPYEDTIKLKFDHTFEKKIRITEPGYYKLDFYKRQFINIVLDKSDLDITADANEPDGFFEIKGSPDQDLVLQLQKIVEDAQKSEAALAIGNEFEGASREGNETKIMQLQKRYQEEIMFKAYDSAASLVRKAPVSLGLIYLLQNSSAFDKDRYFSLYLETSDRAKKEWPENLYSKEFVSYVDRLKKTAIGQPAPEISLPTPEGKVVSLSSFKGKYVLVDFWAKWCGPCRQENPNVVKAYKQFNGKGFEILGVSLDRVKQDWIAAIQEDGLVWTQVSDLKYFDCQAAKDYNIEGIPFSVLVDPNGVIIAKNLRGIDLQKKLEEVLNKKI